MNTEEEALKDWVPTAWTVIGTISRGRKDDTTTHPPRRWICHVCADTACKAASHASHDIAMRLWARGEFNKDEYALWAMEIVGVFLGEHQDAYCGAEAICESVHAIRWTEDA